MKKWTTMFVLVSIFVIALQVNCFARSVMVLNSVAVFGSEEDIESRTPCGSFNRDDIVEAYYFDKVTVKDVEYVLAVGRKFKNNKAVYTKGYVDKSNLTYIYENIRTLGELSPNEISTLMLGATNAIKDAVGVHPIADADDLIMNGYIDMQVADHCAVVSFEEMDGVHNILYKVEYLFTFDEHRTGEYRVLYVEQNGKGVFGSYTPFDETDTLEALMGVSFSGFTYEE